MNKNLDDVFKDVICNKNNGFIYPKDKSVYIDKVDNLSLLFSSIKKLDYNKTSITQSQILYLIEVLNMVNFITDKNSKIISQKSKHFLNKVIVSSDLSNIDSVLLTTEVLSSIKNEYNLEKKDLFNNFVISFYLEEYLARKLKNKTVISSVIKNRLSNIQNNIKYYLNLKNNNVNDITNYIFEMEVINHIYPLINSYINSLKLMEISNKKLVLEDIKNVLINKNTTEDLLNKYEVDKLDSKAIVYKKLELFNK